MIPAFDLLDDDALVGSQQAQSMDTGSGNNYAVTRISQRVTHGNHFVSNIRSKGNDPKRRISVQFMEHVL